jgi:hypothetical protein
MFESACIGKVIENRSTTRRLSGNRIDTEDSMTGRDHPLDDGVAKKTARSGDQNCAHPALCILQGPAAAILALGSE